MLLFAFGMTLAFSLGPMGPDAAREPQLAARGSLVALTFGAGGAVYFSGSHDSGKTFSPPVKVAQGAILPLNRHRGPRIAISRNTIVITAVMGRTPSHEQHAHGLPSDGDLVAWRSTDGGKTWSTGTTINDVPGAPTEGLHGVAADENGHWFAAWLDKRSSKGTKLYGARSMDDGLTWSKNFLIYRSPDGTICECCHPSVAIDPQGQMVVMWRNWLNGSRDLYLAASPDGSTFSNPVKLGSGTWKLNGCPMDGGAIAVEHGRILTAWRRGDEVFLDRPGEPETAVGQGIDVGMSAGAAGVYLIWKSVSGIRLLAPGKSDPIPVSEKGTFPAVAALPHGGAVIAWEDDGKIELQEVPQ